MTPSRWTEIEALFLRAIEIPPGERSAFLDQECHGDSTLLNEVNSLLANDRPDAPLMTSPLPEMPDPRGDQAGRRIGVYRLVGLLGQGGVGSVHLAVRDDEQFH